MSMESNHWHCYKTLPFILGVRKKLPGPWEFRLTWRPAPVISVRSWFKLDTLDTLFLTWCRCEIRFVMNKLYLGCRVAKKPSAADRLKELFNLPSDSYLSFSWPGVVVVVALIFLWKWGNCFILRPPFLFKVTKVIKRSRRFTLFNHSNWFSRILTADCRSFYETGHLFATKLRKRNLTSLVWRKDLDLLQSLQFRFPRHRIVSHPLQRDAFAIKI